MRATAAVPDRIAVLGGGLMGCCAALALAARGARVVVFDRRAAPMLEASRNTEGKLHLGFVYAGDASLRTARLMQRGALAFRPLLRRWLGGAALAPLASRPFVYAVHRDSQLPVDAIAAHLARVRDLWTGPSEEVAVEPLSRAELGATYDAAQVAGAFRTGEIALDARALARLVTGALAAEPRIAFRDGFEVASVEGEAGRFRIHGRAAGQACHDGPFAQVVNCLWANRVAVDIASGLPAPGANFTRHKLGLWLRPGAERIRDLPSTTFVLGPFGDVVAWPDGAVYVSWYLAGLVASTRRTDPSDWMAMRAGVDARGVAAATIAGLARLCPGLPGMLEGLESEVDGGAIYALGETDIDDPRSRLHERFAVGPVTLRPGYHSVDTGKFTLAPLFAEEVAARILGAEQAALP